jgi:hypothetical protein
MNVNTTLLCNKPQSTNMVELDGLDQKHPIGLVGVFPTCCKVAGGSNQRNWKLSQNITSMDGNHEKTSHT